MNLAVFSAEDNLKANLVLTGEKLIKSYLYNVENKNGQYNHFAMSAIKDEYDELNKVFNDGLIKKAYEYSGMASEFSLDAKDISNTLRRRPAFAEAVFAIVVETLDASMTKSTVEGLSPLIEARNMAQGDSMNFEIGNKGLYVVSQTANGVNSGIVQRHYNNNVVIEPAVYEVTVAIDLYAMLAEGGDWGRQLAKLNKSFMTKLTIDTMNLIFDSYGSLGAFEKAAFTYDNYVELAETVAATNDSPVVSFGTKQTWGKTLPSTAGLQYGIGNEYVKTGVIDGIYGYPSVVLDQAVDSSFALQVPNDKIIIASPGVDKPIKVVYEGITEVLPIEGRNTANNRQSYTLIHRYGIGLVSSEYYGIINV